MKRFIRLKQIGCLVLVMLMLLGLKEKVFAVSSEELANPVRDASTHWHKPDILTGTPGPHKTTYHYVYFGSYPQKEILGDEITDELRNAVYDINGDAVIDGKKYRRLSWEMMTTTGGYNQVSERGWTATSDNGYRYYEYEPLRWRILNNDGSKLFLFADNILDAQLPCYGTWETCDLRSWLNYDGTTEIDLAGAYNNSRGFLCCAFDKEEQNRILETEVVQDANPYYKKSDGSPLINGSNTRDKVFLPSFSEVTKEEYGFCCTRTGEDSKQWQCNQASNISTDYSTALVYAGRDFNIDRYWLRTIGKTSSDLMYVGGVDGAMRTFGYPCMMDNLGIAPALNASYRLSDCIKINFNTNGAGEMESQILLGSNYAKEPVEPKKEEYVFGGWYTDAACTKPYHFNRKLTEDTTLYAKWNSYVTVSFQTNGGEGIASQTIVEGSPAKKPADPKKEDYVFTGWYLDKDCTVLYDFKQGIKGNTALYAGWRQREPEQNEIFIKGDVSYKVTSSSAKIIEYCGIDTKRAKTIKSITIPSTVVYKNITYKVTGIGKNACRNYKKLKKITIGKNITSIGSNAFYGCSKLTSVIYKGTNVTKIGNGAFRKCSGLKSVMIPKAVKEIGKDAFRDCKKLSKIAFKGTVLKKVGKNAFKNINKNAVFKAPKKKYKAYKKLLKKNVGYKSSMKIKK